MLKLDAKKMSACFWGLALLSALICIGLIIKAGDALPYKDERDYFALAERLFTVGAYVNDAGGVSAYRPPGYPFFLTPFMAMEHGVVAAKVVNVLVLVLVLILMRDLINREAPMWGWLAGGAAIAYPVWLYTASTLYPQTLCLALLLAITYLLTSQRLSVGSVVGSGVLLGLLILIAPSFQLIAPFFAFYLLLATQGTWVKRFLLAAILTIATVATIAPWIVRNYVVFNTFIPVATNGGVNLLLGNSPNTGPNSGVNVDLSAYQSQLSGLDEVSQSRKYQTLAIEWITQNPSDAATLYAKKALNYFNYRAEPVTQNVGAPNSKDLIMFLTYYPLLLVVLVRLALCKRYPLSKAEWLMAAIYFVNALIAAIFFTRIRFRLPFDGLLWVLAVTSLAAMAQGWMGQQRPPYSRGGDFPVTR